VVPAIVLPSAVACVCVKAGRRQIDSRSHDVDAVDGDGDGADRQRLQLSQRHSVDLTAAQVGRDVHLIVLHEPNQLRLLVRVGEALEVDVGQCTLSRAGAEVRLDVRGTGERLHRPDGDARAVAQHQADDV
jgi:hypothetical protein